MSLQLSSNHVNARLLKLLMQCSSQVHIKTNLSTNKKTHYDTLQIKSNATYNEIKSAYYKLTLKYHPDKNKSTSAKQIFQEVVNAYEVLGNYKLRKTYDRSLAITHKHLNQMQRPKEGYAENAPEKVYNFDEWTRAHYQYNFQRSQNQKRRWEEYNESQKKQAVSDNTLDVTSFVTLIICCTSLLVMFLIDRNNDTPIKKPES